MHITSSQPKEAGADTREAPHERLLSNVRPDDTHAQHAKVSAPRNPSDTGSQEPDAQQGECFFSEEIQGGLQLDKIGSGDTDAVAGLAEDVVVDTPARDVALDNPGDCFVGAYQAAHDPQLLQHTLGRSLPSPQALPQVVDQMMANAELNTQTAVAVASLYKERALCGRELEEHPLVDLLPTESEVEETIMTAATNVEGLAPEAGQLETLKQSLGQHTKSEERSESQ